MKRFHILLLSFLLFAGISAVSINAPVNHHDDVCISTVSNGSTIAVPATIKASTQASTEIFSPAEIPVAICIPLPAKDEFVVYGTLGEAKSFPGFVQNNKAPPKDRQTYFG